MFEHSVKVPRHYKVAANIFKKVSTEGGSIKTLLYDEKLKHFRTNVLFALLTETIKHAADIDKIFENCSILQTETRLDPWLAKVLTAELLFGKKALPGKSKPEQTVFSYKEQFEKFASEHPDVLKTEVNRRPRYVRINTNLLTTSDAIGAFQEEGYRFIRCTSGSYDEYLKQIQNLTEYDFTQDYHVKTVFVFSSGTKLHEHDLYLENKIVLQDKATAMAVQLMAPPQGSVVMDLCAAPGMKTTQLAAYIRNTGKIYAVERNEKRYETLCDFVSKTGSTCVETIHGDALEIKRGDYDDVEYILLDPSCSGSGMDFCVHSYIEDTRLAKLTSLQEKFLKHAMNSFPKAKRIVYSTCSLYPEENERVITNVVKTSRAKWRVQDVKELLKGNWNNFGSGMYGSMGARCMYAKPDSDFTTGFFLAVLDRDQKDIEKAQNYESGNTDATSIKDNIEEDFDDYSATENSQKKKSKKIRGKLQEESLEGVEEKKKKKKKKDKNYSESAEAPADSTDETVSTECKVNESTKKSKKRIASETAHESTEKEKPLEPLELEYSGEKVCKKKKKDKNNSEGAAKLSDSIDETVFTECDGKESTKKSKKRKKSQTADDPNEAEKRKQLEIEYSGEEVKKKKKKDKESAELQSVIVEDSEFNDAPKKKKKKKQKHSEIED